MPFASAREAYLRRQGFWCAGIAITVVVAMCVIALLVGWILLWSFREGGPNVALLTVGCVAFTVVLIVLAVLQNRVLVHARVQQAEAVFLAGVSHNLRTPISGIRAAAQALDRPDLEGEQRDKLLRSIVYQTRRLALRVDNVLETGRIEVERQAFEQSRVDLSALVHGQLAEVAVIVESRGGGLDLDIAPDVTVEGDERALRLVADNLLDNALKYSEGALLLRVSLERRDGFAVLRVVDAGLGFGPAESERLFVRFGRGDNDRGGIGLGLPLARAIARAHGGDVRLHSEGRGTGAQAEVWLPRADEGARW